MKHSGALGCVLLGSLFVFAASCSSKDTPPVYAGGGSGGTVDSAGGSGGRSSSGGKGGKGGTSGSAEAGGEAGETSISPLAPQLAITSPTEATDPNTDAVLIDTQVTVLCTAKSSTADGASPIDPSTIALALLGADGKAIKSITGTPTANANEYSATFQLADVSSGSVAFTCSAGDTASPVHRAVATVESLVDHGPTITIGEPAVGSAHNLLAPLNVQFSVAPTPLTNHDTEADVDVVTLFINGLKIPTTSGTAGTYQASVDFTAAKLFPSPPSGQIPVLIQATNHRSKPMAATGTETYNFVLDGTGPVITLLSPAEKAVIGPSSVLTFTVSDSGSGVDQSTVAVKVNGSTYTYSPTDPKWSIDSTGTFVFKMGNAVANDSADTQLTIDVLSLDKAANSSEASRVFNLDTTPPAVDLDPLATYELNSNNTCSDLFDPVGTVAPNDLSLITNYGTFRAVVFDETNTKPGQTDFFYAEADPNSAHLYVQPDVTQPLLQDMNKDGVCDEIWTGIAPHQYRPTDKALEFVDLKPLNFVSGSPPLTGQHVPACTPANSGGLPLCSGHSDMTVSLHHTAPLSPPVPIIYAIAPDPDTSKATCTGTEWDVGTATRMFEGMTQLGWVCLAARAVDTVGNVGISPPLRICLDDGTNPHRCDGITPPTCTDSCTPPPHFQLPTSGIFNN